MNDNRDEIVERVSKRFALWHERYPDVFAAAEGIRAKGTIRLIADTHTAGISRLTPISLRSIHLCQSVNKFRSDIHPNLVAYPVLRRV